MRLLPIALMVLSASCSALEKSDFLGMWKGLSRDTSPVAIEVFFQESGLMEVREAVEMEGKLGRISAHGEWYFEGDSLRFRIITGWARFDDETPFKTGTSESSFSRIAISNGPPRFLRMSNCSWASCPGVELEYLGEIRQFTLPRVESGASVRPFFARGSTREDPRFPGFPRAFHGRWYDLTGRVKPVWGK